jgi:hypothetical protein
LVLKGGQIPLECERVKFVEENCLAALVGNDAESVDMTCSIEESHNTLHVTIGCKYAVGFTEAIENQNFQSVHSGSLSNVLFLSSLYVKA